MILTREEIEQRMDELAWEYVETQKIIDELYELADELLEIEKESKVKSP
jgi:hypothetical protein